MKQMQVDRFEEHFVVLVDEEDNVINLDKTFFDFELHEGDILNVKFEHEKPISAEFLAEETVRAKERVRRLMEKIKNKS